MPLSAGRNKVAERQFYEGVRAWKRGDPCPNDLTNRSTGWLWARNQNLPRKETASSK
jgi:hypothetical protein